MRNHLIINYLEHKYLQLHQEMVAPDRQLLGYSIYKRDFAARTFRLLKLARAALIYLSLAAWSEERRRDRGGGRKPAVSLPVGVWGDEWKQWPRCSASLSHRIADYSGLMQLQVAFERELEEFLRRFSHIEMVFSRELPGERAKRNNVG